MRAPYRWEAALIAVAAIWGSTFTVVQDAVERIPPFLYLSLRFALATVVMVAFGAARGITRTEATAGALIGTALFAGYAFQTVGLQYTSASNAGFITGMFVVFTPLLGAIALRVLPSRAATAGVVLSTTGLVLLAMPAGFTMGGGDALEVMTAISFAVHILLISRLAPGLSAVRLTTVQLATAAVLTTLWTATAERHPIPTDGFVWFAIVFTAVFATAVAFAIQTRAQQHIPPVRTAVILTAEPVFAGIFGFAVAGDRLGARGYAGAALIVVGILVAELGASARERL